MLVYVAATLDNSSLWLDELMSMYYSDPAHAAAGELWSRMTTDLHPPGYYVVLYVWRELFGSSEVAVRLLSTTIMVVVAIIYLLHVTRSFGPRVAALALPVVVVSHVFLVYAQEVRGYALLMLLTLVCTLLYVKACRNDAPLGRTLPAMVALCFLTETIHPYGVLWAGAVCAGLLVFRRTWRERLVIVAGGVLLLLYPAARLAWMASLAEGTYNWFAYLHPIEELLLGLSRPLLVRQDAWLLVALALIVAWWTATRQIEWRPLARTAPLWILLGGFTASALLVHYLIEPSFSDRNLVIGAPVIWLLSAHGLALVRRSRLNNALLATCVGLLVANHALRADWLARGFKSEWRASARLVDEHYPACAATPIPAFAYVDAERDEYFYEFYLENDFQFRFIDRTELRGVPEAAAPGGCPIKFWSPHGLAPEALGSAAALSALGLRVLTFEHAAPWSGETFSEAFIITAN
jgi:hypothetical protein